MKILNYSLHMYQHAKMIFLRVWARKVDMYIKEGKKKQKLCIGIHMWWWGMGRGRRGEGRKATTQKASKLWDHHHKHQFTAISQFVNLITPTYEARTHQYAYHVHVRYVSDIDTYTTLCIETPKPYRMLRTQKLMCPSSICFQKIM